MTEVKRVWEIIPEPDTCLLTQGILCLGPVTRGGCEALCVKAHMPCTGCFGPLGGVQDYGAKAIAAVASLLDVIEEADVDAAIERIADPVGTFYRYSLPASLLHRRVGVPRGGGDVSREILIDPITRLEGHGKIDIFLDDEGEVDHAYLQIPELRGFEMFAQGRRAEEMPQITSRICGVCPTAHHMAGTKALDDLYQVEPPPAAKKIRELVYDAFMFEDHALHFYFLGGPDFIVGPDGADGRAQHPRRDRQGRPRDRQGRSSACAAECAS